MVVHFKIWLLALALVLPLQTQVFVISQNVTCNSDDLRGLKGFMNGLESAIDGWWPTNSSSFSNCCNWVGVTCNSSSGRIIKLELTHKKLTGNLSDSISNFDHLSALNLSHNFIKGPLPVSLFHLSNLEILDLSSNEFIGVLPISINLPALQVLDISDNNFSGLLPSGLCANSTRIRDLRFAVNYFNGTIPSDFGNCSFLEHLCLASNFVSGDIPEFLFRLPRLRELALQDNRFTTISGIANSSSRLVRLDVSSNRIAGNVPDMFHMFPSLRYFIAHSNNLSGGIPPSLSNSRTVSYLNLRNNSLNGSIDFNCSMMVNLTSLDLGTNNFSGLIPANLASCQNLKALNLARNKLVGQIPETFKNFSSLSYLSLSNCSFNNLSNSLKILQHCPNLSVLVLTMNFHNEQLPSDNNLQFKSLKALVIANCRLTGPIPSWLNGLTNLQLLDLSWNQLTGTIPAYMGDFKFLFYLDLSNNTLSGSIPKNLTELQSLISRDISLEEPSPDFPFFKKKSTIGRGMTLQYNQIMSFPPSIDLSNNFLTGPIWPEFGNLKKLHVLDLKRNNLSGTIPSSLSGMRSIETLDLSFNGLTGVIPSSLVKLSFLSKFSVAYNNLTGTIPNGGQFPTFMNSSFEGNEGLCGGGHTILGCESRLIPESTTRKIKKNIGKITGMAIGICFAALVILAVIFMVVIRSTTRRVVDPEQEGGFDEDDSDKKGDEPESRLVLFHNKDKELSIDDILKSTNSFDQANIIGCGGFGLVFKATLPDNQKVAIKRLSGDNGQVDREFQAEVETLSKAQHPNLVLLQGYCKYKNERLLIYSFMENGSLDYWLHEKPDGPSILDWTTRLNIAQGAIRGLAYLHQSCEPHILHRDIKSSNILLDEHFEAHLADFGLARLVLPYETHVTTDLVGTLGYIPPEYGQASVASYKGDVYSFGVVLLELLTGRRPMDMCKPKADRDLISWVMQMKTEKRENEVIDSLIFDKDRANEMILVLDIACVCLNESPKLRPSTRELLSWLDNVGVRKQ
ncbi:phytosulfokine receptor 1-like [Rutidosis leptorrhynchoides]|uniref:phytosulfokine receptor 1-like n=1 Tax=Rutidosis leptorrhynchoides TaxID=125765 RepID=UPI003A9A4B1E